MYLIKTYIRFRRGKKSVRKLSYSEWPGTRRRFINIAFQLFFGICHQEGPKEPGRTEIQWDTSVLSYADDVNIKKKYLISVEF
jgi:hypothetical protein